MERLIQVSFGEENQRLRFPWPWILIPHTNLFVKQAQIIKSTNVNIEHGEFQRCFFVICVSQYKSFPYFSYSPISKKNQREMGIADENVKSKTPIGTVLVAEIHNEL
jgi:hypothetical protein